MFLINHVSPQSATGFIKEFYARFPENIAPPAPLLVMSASPGLLEKQIEMTGYFQTHQRLEPLFLAAVRYLAASLHGYTACIDFNGKLLQSAGLTGTELEIMVADPMAAPFEDKERRLLAFVKHAMTTPRKIGKADIAALTALGWEESDLVDAVYIGAYMHVAGAVTQTFCE